MRRLTAFGGLALRGARYHWRTGLGTALGVAVASGVLAGALLVGDSVRWTLARLASLRLGRVVLAIDAGGRHIREDLAPALSGRLGAPATAVLSTRGVALRDAVGPGESAQVNRVVVLGVDASFWTLAEEACPPPAADEIALNEKLACALGAKPGDEIALRLEQPTLLPRDAPLSSRKERISRRFALRVCRVVTDTQLGQFSTVADQAPPYNAFVPRAWLQDHLGLAQRANLLLLGETAAGGPSIESATAALRAVWRLEHAGIRIGPSPVSGVLQLGSDRVFLDRAVARTALAEASSGQAVGALAYLVNSISASGTLAAARTPYSFVTACSPSDDRRLSPVPRDMRDDEILVSPWLADCLGVGRGGSVAMRFSRLLPSGAFADESRLFAVRGILSTNDLARERALMPDFPGLSDVETCREWDLGLPMNDADLRDPDNEAYWKQFRATPKAVVTLAAGRAMWSNRFGDLTSVRYAGSAENVAAVAERLRAALDPADLGLFFVPVREWAARAASQGMDFGPLFLGMSAFLIAASLLLAAMLFVFGVQQRSAEIGLLRAVGYRPEHVRALLLIEGGAAACAGTLVGVPLGELLARVLVLGLGTFWKGAVAGSPISYHARVGTVLVGECAGVLCAMLAIAVATWSRACRAPRELLLSDIESEPETTRRGRPVLRPWVAATAASAAGGLIAWTMAAKPRDVAAVFFGAGALLLVAGLAAASALLARLARTPRRLTLGGLAFRNAARRPGRSLATAGLLACGGFMVLAVSSMREDVGKHVAERGSGTGGFALFAESTIPVPDPLNSSKARKAFGLDAEPALAGATILSLRVRDGDDASCLNLNRAQAPRLIGVNAGELARLGAFAPTGQSERVWAALRPTGGGAEMPGLAGDLNTAMWGLKKRVGAEKGDVLNYRDESGEPFGVKLAGVLPMRVSVFQGAVLVPMEALAARFPSEAGYRVFLVDLPPGANTERARRALARRLERVGLDIVPCRERLEAFYTVEATYLTMFLALGGLGLALGSAGVGIVVLRNVLERRSELAVLRCIGFRRKDVQQLVAAEHRLLLVIGMAVGGMAALAAMWPNLRAPGTNLRVGAVAAIIAGLLAIGAAWIGLVARVAVRGRPAAALADT